MIPSLQVDVRRQERMEIHLDITFPRLPCYIISVDVMDVSGEQQNDIEHTMIKTRLDEKGNKVAVDKGQLGSQHIEEAHEAINNTLAADYCGSCYKEDKPASGCCNTCEEVEAAYIRSKWSFSIGQRNWPNKTMKVVLSAVFLLSTKSKEISMLLRVSEPLSGRFSGSKFTQPLIQKISLFPISVRLSPLKRQELSARNGPHSRHSGIPQNS